MLRILDEKTQAILTEVPITACKHSRFNTRKTRGPEAVQKLAERISRNGFEQTRALWAVQAEDGDYEVFAGGTRLEAAKTAGLLTVPAVLHTGLTDEEISCKSDEDNENDEYHVPVGPVDVWAEYARLRDEEGWTQEQIAKAKGVARSLVSERIRWHGLSDKVKRSVLTGDLAEGHLREITGIVLTLELSPWLTSKQAWEELVAKAVYDKGKNGDKSVRALRQDVDTWKEFVGYAQQVYESLPETVALYDLSDNNPIEKEGRPRQDFLAALVFRNARSLVKVKAAEQEVRSAIADNLAAYGRFVAAKSAEAARHAEKSVNEQRILTKFVHGDCVEALKHWQNGPIRLLLTDPPYGIDYQSNRRWQSKAPDKLHGDSRHEAMDLLANAIAAAVPHLAPDAHVLVFCGWKREPEVRSIIAAAGLQIKGSLVWVKEEHSAGDVRGAFAPRHERIVHAVQGVPEITPRIPDVLEVARSRESTHPTEKPVELLRRLINSTTAEGDLVADPFAGQASTLVAALQTGRDFWGAEIDGAHHDAGSARLLKQGVRHAG